MIQPLMKKYQKIISRGKTIRYHENLQFGIWNCSSYYIACDRLIYNQHFNYMYPEIEQRPISPHGENRQFCIVREFRKSWKIFLWKVIFPFDFFCNSSKSWQFVFDVNISLLFGMKIDVLFLHQANLNRKSAIWPIFDKICQHLAGKK